MIGSQSAVVQNVARSRVRYYIVAILFILTAINYGDRATLSMVASPMGHQLGLTSVSLGYIFSAFSWAYVIAQLPGGWLLDRFGSRRVYLWSITLWSVFTLLQGLVGHLGSLSVIISALFLLRFLVGVAEAPSFPGNSRVVAAWFPAQERGTASAIFNSAQYFATVIFAPLMGYLVAQWQWESVFFVMGVIGLVGAVLWTLFVQPPKQHPMVNQAELDYIADGGALVELDQPASQNAGPALAKPKLNWHTFSQLLGSRTLLGTYLAQYCINALTYFFITWFPVYLVQARHMSILNAGFVAAIPAVCGFAGGILGGVISDGILRKSGSLTWARKIPIVAGMVLSMSMIFCNYVDIQWMVIVFMALSFFGKGVGALGWAVMSDIAPREISGLSGSLFNMIGNISGIVTPIAIGYIIHATGSYNGALVFVGIHALVAAISYLVIVGRIERVTLRPQ